MSVKAVLKNGCYMYMYVHVHCVICRLQRRTLCKKTVKSTAPPTPAEELRNKIIKRAALEFKDGMYGILGNKQ